MTLPWLYVVVAGLLEIGFTTCLKLSEGLTKPWPVVGFLVFAAGSFGILTIAMEKIPLGTCYAVWTGIGALGTALIGIIWFRDPVNFWRVFFLLGIVVCIVGLKMSSPDTSGH